MAALLALCALPWLAGLGTELQDVDSAQYADVAKHIARDGQWLTLRDSAGPFVNKPPLAIWAQAVTISALGPTPVAARLPSVLFAAIAVAATFGLGRALFDAQRGWTAAALFAGSVALQQMVLDPKVDLALTAMATSALWAFVEARRRPGFLWLGWVCTGLAVLSKGPLGLALPAAAIAPEAIRHRWGSVEKGTLAQRLFALKPVRGVAIVAALAAPYYVGVYRQTGTDGAGFVLWRQNVGRLFGQSGYSDTTTPLFFFHTALWVFLPFTPLLVLAIVRGLKRGPFAPSEQRIVWWGLWLPFAVFSLSTYKLPQYIFCLAPVASVIAADALVGLSDRAAARLRLGSVALAVLAAAAGAWLVIDCFPAGLGLVALAVPLGAWLLDRKVGIVAGSLLGLHLVLAGWVFPAAVSFQAGKALADRARAEDPGAYMLPFIDVPSTYGAAYPAEGFANRIGIDELRALVETKKLTTAVVDAAHWPDFAAAGLEATSIAKFPAYPTSRRKLAFLRAATRESTLQWRELVRVRVK